MSHNDSATATDELACKHGGCDRTFGNAGAKARHEQACDAKDDGEPESESGEGAGFRESDMLAREIPEACKRASERELRATVESLDYSPTPEETLADSCAKALVRAKGGGREMFADVFGECAVDGCDYGCNGFSAATCKRHADADASEGEPDGEPDSHDGVAIAADLLADGVAGENAAAAVKAAESVDAPESWAAAYGRVLDRVASPAKAKAFADALYPDA
jgi:hypothetical protein